MNYSHNQLYLFHALIVGPLLAYIGYKGSQTPEAIFKILLVFGIIVILYHGYMYSKNMKWN